jgi:hypothetical protein
MKRFSFFLAWSISAVAAAGCGGMQPQSGAMTKQPLPSMARYAPLTVHPDRRPSHMLPDAGKKSALLYIGDYATNDVDVYDYASGKQVGVLTGLSEPDGMCVDAKGDIYIANLGGGDVVEYVHGGLKPIDTYNSGGEPLGCSVDAKGDVAVTSFSPSEVVVFVRGNPSKSETYTGPCTSLATMGYDEKGNLVGVGGEGSSSVIACALLSGSKSMIMLKADFNDDFAGGTMWDGKYFAIGDQEAGSGFEGGIIQATLSGKTLIKEGETVVTDSCYNNYVDDPNPFVVGEKNTPVNRKQAKVVVGPNLWCNDAGSSAVDFWNYPAGGLPSRRLNSPPSEPYSAGVSLKQ